MARPSIWANRDFGRRLGGRDDLGLRVARDSLCAFLFGHRRANAGPLQIAILRALELVGVLLVGLVAGAWVDRLRRRPIMIVADLGRAVLLGSIPVAALAGVLGLVATV